LPTPTTSNNSPNEKVITRNRQQIEDAIDRLFNILRTIDVGLATSQPSIHGGATGRIQIELPGVDNPDRVRKLVQGQAARVLGSVSQDEFAPLPGQLNQVPQRQRNGRRPGLPAAQYRHRRGFGHPRRLSLAGRSPPRRTPLLN
jgi:SecD/SecF fusion protein